MSANLALRYGFAQAVGNRVEQVQGDGDAAPDTHNAAVIVALALELGEFGEDAGKARAVLGAALRVQAGLFQIGGRTG
jgi:hypothetical protein